jgi:hypothetical protein
MLTKNCRVVSADQFDEVFREEALIAEFKAPDEETVGFLIKNLARLMP